MKIDTRKIDDWFIFVISIQIAALISIILDILVARQILGFLYITLTPGIILLKTLQLDKKLNLSEMVVLSIGLSVAFSMILGLTINILYPLIGISRPLSVESLVITISFFHFLLCSIWLRKRVSNASMKISKKSFLYAALLIVPFTGLFGASQVNSSGDNTVLLITVLMISGLVALCTIYRKLFPPKIYLLVLVAVMIALLPFVDSQLLTNFIVGGDVHDEFFVFRVTKSRLYWNPQSPATDFPQFDTEILKANAMISVTILPTIYSQILNLDGTWVFKIIYPLFAFFGVFALYQFYCTQTDKKTSFISSFFFLSICIGVGWGTDKQLVAQLFYVLLLYVLFKREFSFSMKKLLFIVFSAALVISHYSLAYLFLFIITLTWLFLFIMRRYSTKISLTSVAIFFTLTFTWNMYISKSAPFEDLMQVTESVSRRFFEDLLNPQSRGAAVMRGLAISSESVSLLRNISRALFVFTELLILVGVIKCVFSIISKRQKLDFDIEYSALIIVNFILIAINIVLPGLAVSFLMQRFYQTALLILAPLCIVGGKTILGFLPKMRKRDVSTILTLAVIIPFFLFQTDFIYAVTDDYMTNMILGVERINDVELYVWVTNEQEVSGAQWFSEHANISSVTLYADGPSFLHHLTSYGFINREHMRILNTSMISGNNSFIYLRKVNVVDGIIQGKYLRQWNTSDILPSLSNQSKIYSNGNCDIYKVDNP